MFLYTSIIVRGDQKQQAETMNEGRRSNKRKQGREEFRINNGEKHKRGTKTIGSE
jgi:hypothetical protein